MSERFSFLELLALSGKMMVQAPCHSLHSHQFHHKMLIQLPQEKAMADEDQESAACFG